MKKFIGVIAGAFALLAATSVQAQDKNWFAGPNVGATWTQGAQLGFNGGYQVNKYFGVETVYDHVFNAANALDQVGANLVLGYPVSGTKLTPYALTGLGYQWQGGINQGIWNVGGGVKVELAKDVDMDVRYRYVQGMYNQTNANMVTLGTTFRF